MNIVHESINADNFRSYNQHKFGIDLLSRFIETEAFKKLNAVDKSNVLTNYKNMLLSKSYIDHFVFKKKQQTISNYRLLKKLKQVFLGAESNDLDSLFTPDYSNMTGSPTEWTNLVKNEICDFNAHRLDGVWSRAVTNSILQFKNIDWSQFSQLDHDTAQIMGHASYGLYFLRGGLDVAKLIKHTVVNDPFYEQHQISRSDRLAVQWEMRFGQILNDIILWGPVNAATFYSLQDVKGDILTAALLVADLLLSIYVYFKTKAFFEKTLETLPEAIHDQLKESFAVTQNKQLWFIGYQVVLVTAFSGMCGFFLSHLNPSQALNFGLYGALVCFSFQVLVNLIQLAFELQQAKDGAETKIALFKIFTRIMVQLTIPALFLASAYLLPLAHVQVPSLLLAALLIVFSSLLVRLVNDINQVFEAYMKPITNDKKQTDLLAQIEKEPDAIQKNALKDEWVELYESSYSQKNARNKLCNDLWLTGAYLSASVSLCLLIAGFSTQILVPLLFTLVCIGMLLTQQKLPENPVLALNDELTKLAISKV